MTVAIACEHCPPPWINTNSPGVSPESKIIGLETRETQRRGLELAEDNPFSRLQIARQKLTAIYNECNEDDWDGLGARAVPIEAIEESLDFVAKIPLDYPMPEIYPEEGEITLEWHTGRYKTVLLSVRGDGFVYYNGLFGFKDADSGSKSLRDKINPEVISYLDKLYP